jgi:hypothetical protein
MYDGKDNRLDPDATTKSMKTMGEDAALQAQISQKQRAPSREADEHYQ